MSGAFMSPAVAAIAGRGEKYQSGRCIWPGCNQEVPGQDHIMKGCRCRPRNTIRRPRDKLQERWRGPAGKKEDEDERVLEYMEEVVQRTWDQRHPEGVRQRDAKEKAGKKKEEEASKGRTRRSRAAQKLEELEVPEESDAEGAKEEEEEEEKEDVE